MFESGQCPGRRAELVDGLSCGVSVRSWVIPRAGGGSRPGRTRVAAAAPVSPSPMPAYRARGPVPGALAATAQGICPRALANRAAGVTRTVALRP